MAWWITFASIQKPRLYVKFGLVRVERGMGALYISILGL